MILLWLITFLLFLLYPEVEAKGDVGQKRRPEAAVLLGAAREKFLAAKGVSLILCRMTHRGPAQQKPGVSGKQACYSFFIGLLPGAIFALANSVVEMGEGSGAVWLGALNICVWVMFWGLLHLGQLFHRMEVKVYFTFVIVLLPPLILWGFLILCFLGWLGVPGLRGFIFHPLFWLSGPAVVALLLINVILW